MAWPISDRWVWANNVGTKGIRGDQSSWALDARQKTNGEPRARASIGRKKTKKEGTWVTSNCAYIGVGNTKEPLGRKTWREQTLAVCSGVGFFLVGQVAPLEWPIARVGGIPEWWEWMNETLIEYCIFCIWYSVWKFYLVIRWPTCSRTACSIYLNRFLYLLYLVYLLKRTFI